MMYSWTPKISMATRITGGFATSVGARVVDRHFAARDRNFSVAGLEALGVGGDGIGANRARGKRIAGGGCGRSRHKAAPR